MLEVARETGLLWFVMQTSMVVDAGALIMTISGTAESDTYDAFAAFILAGQEQADREQVTHVVADIRELEFATSSCLKVLATWLLEVSERSDGRAVHFRSSKKHGWQRRSLTALAACAPGQVQIEAS